jgi:glycosyltransferase involved in cell wall biosynthesis
VLQVIGGSQFGGAIWVVLSYVEALQEHGCDVAVCTSVPRVADVFERAGCDIVSVPGMDREIRPWHDLSSLRTLTRICRRERFTVVHTHTSKAGFVGRAAARLAGVPVVIHTAHGFAFHEASSKSATAFYAILERIAARWSDRLITVSEFHRSWALRLNIAGAERIVTIRNGIAPARVVASRDPDEVRHELGIEASELVLVSAARLAPQKGLETLVKAFALVTRRETSAQLLVVGEGPLRSELESQAQLAGVSHKVRFLGFRSDVADILNASDIAVAPSRWEGLSISVLEAMAARKPVIASDIAGRWECRARRRGGNRPPGARG